MASICKREAKQQESTKETAGPARIFGHFRTVIDLENIKPPECVIDGLLQQGTTAILWGLPGSTKTTHAIDWWARCALGMEWCGAKTTKGISCYLVLEDLAGFKARVDAWQEHNQTKLPPWALSAR